MHLRSRLLRFIYPVLKIYWRFKPYTRVVRVIIKNGNDVLLVHHAYGRDAWGVPGGAINRNEDPKDAAVREAFEETGLHLENLVASRLNPISLDNGDMWVFTVDAPSRDFTIDEVEIADARWYPIGKFPPQILIQAQQALDAAGIPSVLK